MSEACEDRDGRAGGATMLQPVILRFTLNAAAFAAARPTLLLCVYGFLKAVLNEKKNSVP